MVFDFELKMPPVRQAFSLSSFLSALSALAPIIGVDADNADNFLKSRDIVVQHAQVRTQVGLKVF